MAAAVALDQAYVLAKQAIEDADDEAFIAIMKENPKLDTYNKNTTGVYGTPVGWRKPLLGIAIDEENALIVDTILGVLNYNIDIKLKYNEADDSEITAKQYALQKQRELVQEPHDDPHYMMSIDYIVKEIGKKDTRQVGGKRVNRRRSKSRRSKSRRRATSRRRRH